MGQIIAAKCIKCRINTELHLGAGLKYAKLENVLQLFDSQTQQLIQAAVKQNPESVWTVYNEIGTCEGCKKISAVPVFTITRTDGKKLGVAAKCQCGAAVKLSNGNDILTGKDILPCPICGEKMKITGKGNWD